MEDDTTCLEQDYSFPINVSEVAKLIEEKITKTTYKFKYDDSDENLDQDFFVRFNCIQGWFIRCSYKTKVAFLKNCAMQVHELNLLIMIINTLYTVSTKDRIYSLARGNFQATDMKLLPDDNRCLHKDTLEKVMNNEINWFKTLSNNKQYIFLIKLITFADGLVVINNIFAHFIEILNIRSKTSSSRRTKSYATFYSRSRSRVTSFIPSQSDEKLKGIIQYYFHKVVPEKPAESGSNNELTVLLIKWKQFITKYTQHIYTPNTANTDRSSEEDNFSTKTVKADIAIDLIQKHPVWVTMSILKELDNVQVMSKVNDYWANIVKEFKSELTARKALDKEIAALEDQIKTIHFNKNVSKQTPVLRERVTDIIKPSFRKMITPKNMDTNYSLISDVYKDYLVDINLYSKKMQSFPRAINLNKPKTCNI